ncbi:PBS lyase HEAT-like repeat domain containing protein, putative [Babesia bigemina]|uniref:Deoxyhypusine hydroxylase n=1 Tax=Babesia bigemina TaxID=5866 RepID=A0A061D685_BABBI|nr:PBS lyase HEAT-like repeat domain containing protein, putative [Babesia bigemina]CDR94439.1 PBS lyase HEAT-like repeat domain containing protein, putative [Babesia bigemina]|eukprot:XP_012766625.1 PBS lyase HEAT-like repeat domain containing protein, putative [Babesia bigemina]
MADIAAAVEEFSKLDEFSKPDAELLSKILLSPDVKLSLQLRALYFCRDLKSSECATLLKKALDVHYDAFLRHEIAYVIGQAGCEEASDVLVKLLEDENEDPMAAEAIAAIGGKRFIDVIKKYEDDPCVVVHDTCRLALHSLLNGSSEEDDGKEAIPICSCVSAPISTSAYRAVDPVPCTSTEMNERTMKELEVVLLDEALPLYQRYEALFNIRNIGGDAAAAVIGGALVGDKISEVFRHECAFVLGQMQSMAASDALLECLKNADEEPIARHEAALALGSCASVCSGGRNRQLILDALNEYTADPVKVVADSCVVALDVVHEADRLAAAA